MNGCQGPSSVDALLFHLVPGGEFKGLVEADVVSKALNESGWAFNMNQEREVYDHGGQEHAYPLSFLMAQMSLAMSLFSQDMGAGWEIRARCPRNICETFLIRSRLQNESYCKISCFVVRR